MSHMLRRNPVASQRPRATSGATIAGIDRRHFAAAVGSLAVVLLVAVVAVLVSGNGRRAEPASTVAAPASPADRCYSMVMTAVTTDVQSGLGNGQMDVGMRALIQQSGTSSTEFRTYSDVVGLAFNSALQYGTVRGLASVQDEVNRLCRRS